MKKDSVLYKKFCTVVNKEFKRMGKTVKDDKYADDYYTWLEGVIDVLSIDQDFKAGWAKFCMENINLRYRQFKDLK